jgi:predicted nucleic acid-binding protein
MINYGGIMIFLDTGYYIALLNNRDPHHVDSLRIKECLDELNEATVINTTVLVETLNRSVKIDENIKELYDDISSENIIVPLTTQDYLKSLEINGWYKNSINYSDCTIIHTMMDMGITRIVSFDECFRKIGRYEVISSA